MSDESLSDGRAESVLVPDTLAMVGDAAAVHDQAGALTSDYVDCLRVVGLFGDRGLVSGISVRSYVDDLVILARHCASTAFLVHMHHTTRSFLQVMTDDGRHERVATILNEAGDPLFCSLNSEPGMHYRRQATRSSTVTRIETPTGPAARIVADKHFCSGVAHANYAFSLVGPGVAGRPTAVVVPIPHEGIRIGEPVDLLGLRATDSRSVRFDTVLPADHVLEIDRELPTFLWSLGYGAMLHGIGIRAAEALRTLRSDLGRHGRWGEYEQIVLGELTELRAGSAASLDVACRVDGTAEPGLVIVAKRRATEFALRSTRTALELIGGESVHMYSEWCRLFRDANTLSLLPPSRDRSWRLLGSDEPITLVAAQPSDER